MSCGIIFYCWELSEGTQLKETELLLLLLCFKGIGMEAMAENKMVPSDFSTGPMEKTAKLLPFKDPNFVVSI